MTTQLRDGSTVQDPRLGRIPLWDPRNEEYPIRTLLKAEGITAPRTYSWGCYAHLDQGWHGACTGFSTEHELAAYPKRVDGVSYDTGMRRYHKAQHLDPWDGCYKGSACPVDPSGPEVEGSAVIAAVKAAKQDGYYSEYRWASGVDDLASAVSWKGPAILGIDWYEGMFDTFRKRTDGPVWIKIGGEVAGGHAIMCVGYSVTLNAFRLHNSWGSSWGDNSRAWISKANMATLLDGGEACIPVVR